MGIGWPMDFTCLRLKGFLGMELSAVKLNKFWINRDQVVSWVWVRGWVCQSKLPLPLAWNACAVFISEEVHEHLVTQAGDGRQWKLQGKRTLAESYCELCKSRAQPSLIPTDTSHEGPWDGTHLWRAWWRPGVSQGGEAHRTHLSHNARREQKFSHHKQTTTTTKTNATMNDDSASQRRAEEWVRKVQNKIEVTFWKGKNSSQRVHLRLF